ncbi:MAG: flagellar motor protein [Sporolactobacillus sp.]|jgi:chemotaxis protein MotA|nr:flagellar motor protein [Sporolactobacillus sp.]
MDLSTLVGLIFGIASLLIGFTMEGGTLGALLQITAAMIVFGGTIGAVVISFPAGTLKKIPFITKYAFVNRPNDPGETIGQLIDLANISRREGLLALEGEQERFSDDPFMTNGIRMVVDGMDSDVIDDILNRDIELYENKILSFGKMYEEAGGFSPTMGIIGTVMGLVHVLGNLSNPSSLGPSIAVAFIATLYGVASANVIFLPIYNKIKANLDKDVLIRQIKAEGILSIQYGENTLVLRQKLFAFLSEDERQRAEVYLNERGNGEQVQNNHYREVGSHE